MDFKSSMTFVSGFSKIFFFLFWSVSMWSAVRVPRVQGLTFILGVVINLHTSEEIFLHENILQFFSLNYVN